MSRPSWAKEFQDHTSSAEEKHFKSGKERYVQTLFSLEDYQVLPQKKLIGTNPTMDTSVKAQCVKDYFGGGGGDKAGRRWAVWG